MIDNESGEDYLESILRLSEKGKDVHSVDVARELGVSKPAVTKAMRILTQKGYVKITDNHIHLTEAGDAYAKEIYAKHRTITDFLVKLGVGEDAAEADACRMEHLIGEETYAAIRRFLEGSKVRRFCGSRSLFPACVRERGVPAVLRSRGSDR